MSKEIELNDHMIISSAGEEEKNNTRSSSAPLVVQSSVDEKRIRHEQSKQPQDIDEELTAFVEHDTTSINISQEEENLDKIGPFISKLFPTTYQQLLTSEEATDHIPPKNKSVSFLSYKNLSAPNGCETGGTWGTTKYFGFNTCIMCLLYATCGPFAFCVICYPQDRRLAYLVNGKIYDRNGDFIGKEEDSIFQPRVEELVGQTISR